VHLINNEGDGSLLSLLKDDDLATSVEAECDDYRGFTLLTVTIKMTAEGLSNTEELICNFFQYIDLLKSSTPKKWIWEEMKVVPDLEYKYPNKEDTTEAVKTLSYNMLVILIADFVTGFNL